MKLRNRLFLWVGGIFLIAFGVSLFLEIRLTNRNLKRSEDQLRQQILKVNERSRGYIEEYLRNSLRKEKIQIDALFLELEKIPLTSLNPWAMVGQLFFMNNWIDFAQITKDNQLEALLLPLNTLMKSAREERIDELLSWVFVEGRPAYLGISSLNGKEQPNHRKFLFLPEALQKMELTGSLALDRAIAFAKKSPLQNAPTSKSPVELPAKRVQQNLINKNPPPCLSPKGGKLVMEYLQRPHQAEMVAALTSIFPNPILGNSPWFPRAPQGIAHFSKIGNVALFNDEIFYDHILFHPPSGQPKKDSNCEIESGLAVIAPEHLNRVFIGNTFELEKNRFLTIGMGMESILRTIVLTLHQGILVVHKGKQVEGYTVSGEKIKEFQLNTNMLTALNGIAVWKNEPFYYLHLHPFKDLDLHFYVFTPQKEAFSFVNSFDESARGVLEKISWNMRAIALFVFVLVLGLLHNIARRITKPIAELAKATEQVATGKLETIALPPIPDGRHDEIASLCHSFDKMVLDLKEQEKVKGVLNKVVSQDIAKEILKGNIHLGGEVRKITIFFADIRHFTEMTIQLPPQEVVSLLNTCMTKVSHVIDEQGGVIDKYVGDEVMALFGAPIDHGDSALRAIRSALETIQVLRAWNKERAEQGLFPVEMGIGIHTGDVLVGNMGAESRLNYTVLGEAVNLAARFCSVAGKGEILISEATLQEPHVREKITVRELPARELKGFEGKISYYEVVS